MNSSKPFSEVIESSLHTFKAQCWHWDKTPKFGSLVTVQHGTRTVFGLVYQIDMGSMDPIHYPFPYQKTHDELLKEQPQIFEFLKTTISCVVVGFQEKGRIHYLLAPEPSKIHAFVGFPEPDTAKEFFADHGYLHLIFALAPQLVCLDELLLALLRQQRELTSFSTTTMAKFLETFTLLSGNDYRRLKLFLQRAQPFINQ